MRVALPAGEIVPSYSVLVGPVVALAMVWVLAVLLRWVFGNGSTTGQPDRPRRRNRRLPGTGHGVDYGLLVPVAGAGTRGDADRARDVIVRAGLRATVGQGGGPGSPPGQRWVVLVFPADLARASALLGGRR